MRGCSLLLLCVALALATATCPANTYYDQDQGQCLECPPGTTSEQGPADHNSPGCKCDGMPKVLSGAFPIVWSLSFVCAAGCPVSPLRMLSLDVRHVCIVMNSAGNSRRPRLPDGLL